jgi:hypothetical protein
MHPLLGTGLGIVTAGLSSAAFGIYRGVTMKNRERKARKLTVDRPAATSSMSLGVDAKVPEVSDGSFESRDRPHGVAEVPGSEPYHASHQNNVTTTARVHDYAVPSPVSALTSTPTCSTVPNSPVTEISELPEETSRYRLQSHRPNHRPRTIAEIDGSPIQEAPVDEHPPSYVDAMAASSDDKYALVHARI